MLTKVVDTLQLLAHQGYALHTVEVHSVCNKCDSDVIINDPEVIIEKDDENKTVRIKFLKNEPDCD